jgi:Raf kinase inhibitor-like YbhB/YbcL family protein
MNMRMNLFVAAALLGSLIPAGSADESQPPKIMNLSITSTAFSEGQPIPQKYTCEGSDISPPLAWIPQGGTPTNIKSFALIMDDPDAPVGTWVHWVLYDLPATAIELPENTPKLQQLPNGAKQGLNTWPRLGYGGACPPPGKPHRYFFKLYALDTMLNLKSGATKKDVEAAIKGHVLAEGQLMGTYQRK